MLPLYSAFENRSIQMVQKNNDLYNSKQKPRLLILVKAVSKMTKKTNKPAQKPAILSFFPTRIFKVNFILLPCGKTL
jgi:hypothetical protein